MNAQLDIYEANSNNQTERRISECWLIEGSDDYGKNRVNTFNKQAGLKGPHANPKATRDFFTHAQGSSTGDGKPQAKGIKAAIYSTTKTEKIFQDNVGTGDVRISCFA